MWHRDHTIGKSDLTHIDAGLWAIDTANPNCRRRADYLTCSGADAVFIQETRLPEGPKLLEAEAQAA